mmetsp:Transcript_12088/g.15925  ORF Transcript_12088/g.15925 Transcript_12088/m.15925 type:complete len:321 (-) Transcript_12088:183-1145(-)
MWRRASLCAKLAFTQQETRFGGHFSSAVRSSTTSTSLQVGQLFSVTGKSVLVTGGGRGIGKMIAEGFVANGCKVYICSRDEKALAETASELTAGGPGECIAVPGDLGSRAGCEALAEAVSNMTSELHILVNNSGTAWGEPLERKSGKLNWGWDKVLDLNVKAPFYLTRALLPLLGSSSSSADPSRVIMVGSVVGIQPQDAPTHAYDASKAALHSLTKKLAADLADFPLAAGDDDDDDGRRGRVTVNAMAPGFVPSRMSSGLATSSELENANIPIARVATSSDMAGVALFFASPAASWITGTVLPVDGGLLSRPISITSDE